MRAIDLTKRSLKLNETNQITAKRIVIRSERSEFPATDFFTLFALFRQSCAAYVAENNDRAEQLCDATQDLLKRSKLD